MMETWGAEVFASPSNMTQTGRDALAADPENQGSLGLEISEAVEEAASRADTNYALGSVLNHVALIRQSLVSKQKNSSRWRVIGRMLYIPPVAAGRRLLGWPSRLLLTMRRESVMASRCVLSRSSQPRVHR